MLHPHANVIRKRTMAGKAAARGSGALHAPSALVTGPLLYSIYVLYLTILIYS